MQDTERAYLAGIIDADGSIGIYKRRRQCQSIIVQVQICGDAHLMDWLSEVLPESRISMNRRTWLWIASREDLVFAVLSAVLPFLTTKRLEAELALDYMSNGRTNPDYYVKMSHELKVLRHIASGGK